MSSQIDKQEAQRFAQELSMEIEEIYRNKEKDSRVWSWMSRKGLLHKDQKPKASSPLIERKWVPYLCVGAVAMIWMPDEKKVQAMYWIDSMHEKLQLAVHKQYWKYTMPADRYAILMEQIEANVPKAEREKASDCPL